MKIRYFIILMLTIFCFNFSFAQNINTNLKERLMQINLEEDKDDLEEIFNNGKQIIIPFDTPDEIKNAENQKKTTVQPTIWQIANRIQIIDDNLSQKEETFLAQDWKVKINKEIDENYYKVEKENVEKIINEKEKKDLEKNEKIVKQFEPSFNITFNETIRNLFTFPYFILLSLLMIMIFLLFHNLIPLKIILSYFWFLSILLLGISLSLIPLIQINNYFLIPILFILGYILYFSYKNYFIYMNTLIPFNHININKKIKIVSYTIIGVISYFVLVSIHFTRNPIIWYWNNSFNNLTLFDIQNIVLNNSILIGVLLFLFWLLYFYYKKDKWFSLKIIIFFTFILLGSLIFLFL